jgi:hypothetical protein
MDFNVSGQILKVLTLQRNKKEQCIPLPEIFSNFASINQLFETKKA